MKGVVVDMVEKLLLGLVGCVVVIGILSGYFTYQANKHFCQRHYAEIPLQDCIGSDRYRINK